MDIDNTVQVLDQPLYDTMRLAAAAGPLMYQFFTVPYGGLLAAGITKGYQHTNLTQTAQLETGHYFVIEGISMHCKETAQGAARVTLADQVTIAGGFLQIKIGEQVKHTASSDMIPAAGCELSYFSNITAAATEFHVNRGVNALSNRYPIRQTITIKPGTSIKVEVTIVGTIAAVTDLQVILWGTLTKPVI